MASDIREVRFDGPPRRRGRQRGRRLRQTLSIPDIGPLDDDFVDACMEHVRAAYPAAIEEFEGILETSGFDRRRFRRYHFARVESRVGCTMFGLPSDLTPPGAGAIAGHNYDWATADLKWCELHRYRSPHARDRLAYTHHWAGDADVLNEAGLFIAISSLPPAPVQTPGMQWNLTVDMVSELCDTVDEAAEKLASVRHLRPMSYLLADASGDATVVEALPGEVNIREAGAGPVAAANVRRFGRALRDGTNTPPRGVLEQPINPGADSHDPDSERRSRRRVRRVLELLDEGPMDPEAAGRALADHQAPVCRHHDPGWGTIWSAICLPARRRLRIAPGPPCRTGYRTFDLQGG